MQVLVVLNSRMDQHSLDNVSPNSISLFQQYEL